MGKFDQLFKDEPAKNLFGESTLKKSSLSELQLWCSSTNCRYSSLKLEKHLSSINVKQLTREAISLIGNDLVREATLLSTDVERLVTEFDNLNVLVGTPSPKQRCALVLDRLSSTTESLIKRTKRLLRLEITPLLGVAFRQEIKTELAKLVSKVENVHRLHLIPVKLELEARQASRAYHEHQVQELQSVLKFLSSITKDPLLIDQLLKRGEALQRCEILFQLQYKSLDQMLSILEQDLRFKEELIDTIIPMIEVSLRSNVINRESSLIFSEISTRLKDLP